MSASESSMLERYEFAQSIARDAGRLTLDYFQHEFEIEKKTDDSPVTIADREAERLLRAAIVAEFPTDSILGEEFPALEGTSAYRWILDPIDGTKSFVCGVPLYATLVAVEHEGRGIVGVIQLPALNESIVAAEGHGAWYTNHSGDRVPARVGSFRQLSDGLFVTSERKTFDERGAGEVFTQMEAIAVTTRTWGDAYGYALVATGRAVAMLDPKMSIWDAAAIQPILSEAGGVFCDWRGRATIHGGEGIGTTPEVLAEILAITGSYPART